MKDWTVINGDWSYWLPTAYGSSSLSRLCGSASHAVIYPLTATVFVNITVTLFVFPIY